MNYQIICYKLSMDITQYPFVVLIDFATSCLSISGISNEDLSKTLDFRDHWLIQALHTTSSIGTSSEGDCFGLSQRDYTLLL